VRHPDDRNNVDRIGAPDSPGLRKGELTRPEKRDHLLGLGYRGGLVEEMLDAIYGAVEPASSRPEPVKP
jgi:hypothetical protein